MTPLTGAERAFTHLQWGALTPTKFRIIYINDPDLRFLLTGRVVKFNMKFKVFIEFMGEFISTPRYKSNSEPKQRFFFFNKDLSTMSKFERNQTGNCERLLIRLI
jgi:hypothetical protein